MEREVGRDSDVSKEPVLDKFLSSDSVNIHKGVVKVKVEYLSQSEFSPEECVYLSERLRGQNKKRVGFTKIAKNEQLCNSVSRGKTCTLPACKFEHSIERFFAEKPEDLEGLCPSIGLYGNCPFGLSCRFYSSHSENETLIEEKKGFSVKPLDVKNLITFEVQSLLRTRRYNFESSAKILQAIKKGNLNESGVLEECKEEAFNGDWLKERLNNSADVFQPLRNSEKKKIDISGKTFLAPLTTVGNLPFRRICKEFGVDITCAEMAYGVSLLKGRPCELSLVRRHMSEDVFGVQVADAHVDKLTRVSQLIEDNLQVDFVDLNCGCPLDELYKKGIGSGLLLRKNNMKQIIKGMSRMLSCPLSVKLRTGVSTGKNIAHKLIPNLFQWGVNFVTMHGRTREQRYTKAADWEYIKECTIFDHVDSPRPIIGNGDILSWEDVVIHENCGISGFMIGRGALMKPWIFTEIKEKRHWDVSSSERFEMLRRFTNYGLTYWGSDFNGVERTRYFLLEWLSFLCRYVPVGLLERTPQRMNERPPRYFGRDELETLMASQRSSDWIKISELLLGHVPSNFRFEPKHKAHSY